MPSVTFSGNVSIAGVRISYQLTRDMPGVIGQDPTLDAAVAATLSTRTDDDTGILTVATGHGILNSTGGYTLFWDGGLRRALNTVVTNTTVAIDGGAGTVLPVVNTVGNIGLQITLNTDFEGNDVSMYALSAQRRASVQIQTEAGAALQSFDFGVSGNDGEGYMWASNTNTVNPLLNAVVGKMVLANGSSNANGNIVKVGVQYNSEE